MQMRHYRKVSRKEGQAVKKVVLQFDIEFSLGYNTPHPSPLPQGARGIRKKPFLELPLSLVGRG
jgi:hypothetical protein